MLLLISIAFYGVGLFMVWNAHKRRDQQKKYDKGIARIFVLNPKSTNTAGLFVHFCGLLILSIQYESATIYLAIPILVLLIYTRFIDT